VDRRRAGGSEAVLRALPPRDRWAGPRAPPQQLPADPGQHGGGWISGIHLALGGIWARVLGGWTRRHGSRITRGTARRMGSVLRLPRHGAI
jgi:hypothetical protein